VECAQASLSSKLHFDCRAAGGSKRRLWRKVHLGIDEKTLEIPAVGFTGSDIGDAPILPELLNQIPPEQETCSVTADGAYDTRKCHDAIADRSAHAIIPPRKNAKPWKPDTAGAIARNEALTASRYLGRALWRPLSADCFAIACRAMDGADTTAGAASRRRCIVSSCWNKS
jgi:hypothetical protein